MATAKLDIAANAVPVRILPSKKIPFNRNEIEVRDNIYVDDVYHEYNHKGKYRASCSSYLNDNYQPFHAFNYGDSGWMSGIPQGNDNISIYYDGNDTTENNATQYVKLHNGPSFYNSNATTTVKSPPISFSTLGTLSPDDVKGEWLQIDLPFDKPIYLFRYRIKVPPPSYNNAGLPPSIYPDGEYPTDSKYKPDYTPNYAKNPLANYVPKYIDTRVYTNKITDKINVDNNNVSTYDYNNLISNHIPHKYTSHFPKVFIVVGSNDGVNWNYIDQHSFVDPPDIPLNKSNIMKGNSDNFKHGYEVDYSTNTISFEVNSINRYTKFRIIISELFPGNTYAQISEWHLFAYVQNVNANGLTQFANVPYNYRNSKREGQIDRVENFTTNSPDNLKEFIMSSTSIVHEPYENIDKINGELNEIYNNQIKSVNDAKNKKDIILKNIEGFSSNDIPTHGYSEDINSSGNPQDVIKNKINPASQMYADYINTSNAINNNYYVLQNQISDFSNNYFPAVNDKDDTYDLGKAGFNKQPTKIDGWLTDNRELVLHQNSMYIMSTIAVGTLLIGIYLVWK